MTNLSLPCDVWTGNTDTNGYGRYADESVHRFVYEEWNGPLPEGAHIDHVCRNTSCWEPAHLEAVTIGENTRRGIGPSAVNFRKTECVNGHELTDANTYKYRDFRGNVHRYCRKCQQVRDRKRRSR